MNPIRHPLALAAALLLAGAAHAADVLPAGTLIAGTVSGATSTLLGLDHGFDNVAGSHVTALVANDLEYLSGDFAVGIDLFTDGTIQFWNNSADSTLAGSYSFTFSFASPVNLSGIALADTSGLASSARISLQQLSPQQVSISFSNLTFNGDFGNFTVALAAPVPEPASYALLGLGLAALALRRRAAA